MKLRNKKTGEIVDTKDYNFKIATPAEPLYGHDAFDVREEYNSLAELNEEWEDCKPAEPLIKDEKIRKAVRAWAEACGAKQIKYSIAPNQYYDADMGTGFSIKFLTKPVEVYLEEGKIYTIAELCGEWEDER